MALNFATIDLTERKFIPSYKGQRNAENPATFWIVPMSERDYDAITKMRASESGTIELSTARAAIIEKCVKRIENITIGGVKVESGSALVSMLGQVGIDVYYLLLEVVNEIYTISTVSEGEEKN